MVFLPINLSPTVQKHLLTIDFQNYSDIFIDNQPIKELIIWNINNFGLSPPKSPLENLYTVSFLQGNSPGWFRRQDTQQAPSLRFEIFATPFLNSISWAKQQGIQLSEWETKYIHWRLVTSGFEPLMPFQCSRGVFFFFQLLAPVQLATQK